MKVIIAGSRTITNPDYLKLAIHEANFDITEVVSGGAKGADELGEQYARDNEIPLKIFPAKWNQQGKSAGIRRNVDMAKYADALIALWDGDSRGTKHMISVAHSEGLHVFVLQGTRDVTHLMEARQ